MIIGITRGTTRAHIVRATLEAIAFEVRDVLETMPDADRELRSASTAAPSANDLLCRLQADQLGVAVERPEIVETTGLGAAFLAGLGVGRLGLHRRAARDLAARPALRPVPRCRGTRGRRRGVRPLVRRRSSLAGLGLRLSRRDGRDQPAGAGAAGPGGVIRAIRTRRGSAARRRGP